MSLTYPVAPEYKLPLLIPLYLLAPGIIELARRQGLGPSWATYGLGKNPMLLGGLGLGFGLGLLGVAALVGTQVLLGWRTWVTNASDPPTPSLPPLPLLILGVFSLTLFIGWVEELIFRGVLLHGLMATFPWMILVLVASSVFALSHLVWDGPGGMGQLPGLALMGAVLILARWVDGGSLGLPWGLHSGWIFAIALVDSLGLITATNAAPPWLAGKPDQPLTGVAALALLGLTALGLWGLTYLDIVQPGLG
jgi:membrane protease YdiL (CAAX protease family)